MRKLYILLFSFFVSYMSAQLTVSPASLAVNISENSEHLFNVTITNTSGTDVTTWWKLKKASGFPTAWSTTTCDLFTCYTPNFDICPKNKGNVIPANESKTFQVHFYPNGVTGSSSMNLQLFSDKDLTNMIAETDPNAIVLAGTSSTSNVSSNDLKVFPNPTDDYFVVRNDNNVSKVGLYNIVGKEIYTLKHTPGASYDVANLNKGVYIVRLIDTRGKVMKSIRLSKR